MTSPDIPRIGIVDNDQAFIDLISSFVEEIGMTPIALLSPHSTERNIDRIQALELRAVVLGTRIINKNDLSDKRGFELAQDLQKVGIPSLMVLSSEDQAEAQGKELPFINMDKEGGLAIMTAIRSLLNLEDV